VIDADLRRFGRDVALPQSPDEQIRHTASGDLPSAAGRACLEQAIRYCILASPGSLVHRPSYGAGLVDYTELPDTPATRSRAANAIRSALLRDARLRDVRATISAGLSGDTSVAGAVTVEVTYKPQQDAASSSLTLEYQP